MRNFTMQFNIKALIIIGIWSLICTASIVVILVVTHDRSTESINNRLEKIELQLEQKTIDRYHGADARRDFSEVHRQLDEIRSMCNCPRTRM